MSKVTQLRTQPRDAAGVLFDMESDVNTAANASTALSMAIDGMSGVPIAEITKLETGEVEALMWLASEARISADRVRDQYYLISALKR